jgi:hypothetical protein
METRRWTNPTQPQTLQIAVFLLYINAVFALLFGGLASLLGLLLVAGGAAGGFGIANEKKWGYILAVATAVLQVAVVLGSGASLGSVSVLIELGFDVALVVLLAHPMSRSYQRIWFK